MRVKAPLRHPAPKTNQIIADIRSGDPWERQPGEDDNAFFQFTVYRDLPPPERTFKATAEIVKRWMSSVQDLGNRYRWRERVEAWDDYVDKQSRIKQLYESQLMIERHAKMAETLQNILMVLPKAMADKVAEPGFKLDLDANIKSDDPEEKARALEREKFLGYTKLLNSSAMSYRVFADLERISRGLPTEIRENLVEKSSPEQLRGEIRKLLASPEAFRASVLASVTGTGSLERRAIGDGSRTFEGVVSTGEASGAVEPSAGGTGTAPEAEGDRKHAAEEWQKRVDKPILSSMVRGPKPRS